MIKNNKHLQFNSDVYFSYKISRKLEHIVVNSKMKNFNI